jgi:hypothetical protein
MPLTERIIRFIKRKLSKGYPPDFLIVGAQKAGTTGLHYYLMQHPNLVGAYKKEVHYFDNDKNYERGKKWYHNNFKNEQWKKKFLCFESSPAYMYRKEVPLRIKDDYPEMKIIMILRNPVSRAYSGWNFYRTYLSKDLPKKVFKRNLKRVDPDTFKEFYSTEVFPDFEMLINKDIERIKTISPQEEPSIVRRGIYVDQVKRYFDVFGRENVLILGMRDMINDKKKLMNEILKFLGLPESDWSFLKDEVLNAKEYIEKMKPETEAFLNEFYKPYNEQLFELVGRRVNW